MTDNIAVTAGSGTTIATDTMFDDGYPGQVIRVLVADPYTTFDFTGTHLYGNGAVDYAAGNLDWLEAVFDGTNWYCTVHASS